MGRCCGSMPARWCSSGASWTRSRRSARSRCAARCTPSTEPPERYDRRVPGLEACSSLELVSRARQGDADALERLCARYLPRLKRWAHGRLPAWARGPLETDDVVQESLVRSVAQLGDFEPRHEAAFQAYLRQAVLNR